MKRIAYFAVCAVISVVAFVALPRPAVATPFSDVPSSDWAYDYIQTLAADGIIEGYPNGKFMGNRTMTRKEMAAIVARAVAKVQAEGGANKADLEKLQKLMDAYKDELDGLGVRVTSLEDRFGSLDKATQFSQRFSVHGVFNSAYTQRETTISPLTIAGGQARLDPIFKFTDAFIRADALNDPYYGGIGAFAVPTRQQWEFTPQYAVSPNLIVSIPMHIFAYDFGGEFSQQNGVGINPTIDLTVPNITNLKGLNVRVGYLNNLKSSLTGLAYSPPDDFHVVYTNPYRPFPRGADVTGTAFDSLDFQASFFRLDPVGVNTGTFSPNTGVVTSNVYLGPYYFQQSSQNYGSALTSDTFSSGTSTLQTVYLTAGGTPGTIFVSFFLGPGCPTGCSFSGPNQGQPARAAFTYVQTGNAIVFSTPLPAGSTVTITYQGYAVSGNIFPLRYDVNGRVVYHIHGIPQATVGLSFNRVFDLPNDVSYFQSFSIPDTLVSDTVFGLDFVLPLAYKFGPVQTPALFGEVATAKFTRDYVNVPATSDTAGVVGVRFKIYGGDQTFTYQSVGPNFISGAPFRYSGQAPALFAFWNFPQLPGSFGIGNDFALNQAVDNAAIAAGKPGGLVANGAFPFGTFAFPLFNQFMAYGPYYYSSYAPNTRGGSAQLNFPLTIGNVDARLRFSGQELREIRPNSLATQIFGPAFASTVKGKYDALSGGVTLTLPVFERKASVSLDTLYEKLERIDRTAFVYAADPALGLSAYNPIASAELAGTGGTVFFYPDMVNVVHYTGNLSVAVPITAALTANLQYIDQRYGGQAINTLTQSLSEKKTQVTGGVLYNIPNTNSSLNIFFNRYEYHDDVVPTYNYSLNRQNLYFTVRF